MKEFTKRILRFIKETHKIKGVAPSLNQISRKTGLTTAVIRKHLDLLKLHGFINWNSKIQLIEFAPCQNCILLKKKIEELEREMANMQLY